MPLLEVDLPVVGAPMAGGGSTPALGRAVAAAGGFPFLAAGYRGAEALAADVADLRAEVSAFGVNLFVPSPDRIGAEAYAAYAARVRPEADALGAPLPEAAVHDDDAWAAKVDLLVADPVPVVSCTFGLPPADDVRRLRARGTRVLVSVTTPEEARAAADLGVDGLVVQGPRAGGHSATFDPGRVPGDADTATVVAAVRAAVDLPLVAGGGVTGADDVAALLAAGAEAVAVGTLLLRTPESGAPATYRAGLADPAYTRTTLTRAFTGRPARALVNGFVERHDAAAPVGYPELHHLTRPLRTAAAAAGDTGRLHLWAGTGWRSGTEEPAAAVVRRLAARA